MVPQVRRLLKKSGMDRRLAGAGGPACTSGSAGPASPRCTASAASPSTCEAPRLGPWWRSSWRSLASTAGSSRCPHVAVTKRVAQEPCLQRQWPALLCPALPQSGGRAVSRGDRRKNQAVPQRAGSPVVVSTLPCPHRIHVTGTAGSQGTKDCQPLTLEPGDAVCSTQGPPRAPGCLQELPSSTCLVGQSWRLPLDSDKKM